MQVTKLRSYAYFGTKQFSVNVSLMQSSALIEKVKNATAGTYERTYADLTETSPDNIF